MCHVCCGEVQIQDSTALSRVMLSTLRTGRLLAASKHLPSRAVLKAHQARSFWNVSLPVLGGPGGVHITKYNIVKPAKENVEYDDFLIALPEREQLASFTKETPLFIRYLKVVTDQEDRKDDFVVFFERAKNGLTVESDVFISTEELLALMWKNGYSEQERNAVQFTFPADYKFHYPELSALFNLPEEDTYKFCMRTRMENSHIGELDWSKVKRQGFLRDHWIIFGTGLIIFKYFPFFNYYFGIKVFGTSMWVTSMWMLFNRWIATSVRRNEYLAAQKTAQEVMDGEDAIVDAMRRFANDAKCVEDLSAFKSEAEVKVAEYKKAVVMKMREDLTERAHKQLQSIAQFEAGMGSALQELLVREAALSFKEKFPMDQSMQEQALAAAVKSLSGESVDPSDDPVASHFNAAFASLAEAGAATPNADGTLAERVAFAQEQKENEFKQTFMVTAEEVSQVKALAAEGDPENLSPESLKKLESLYMSINNKVGFALPNVVLKPIAASADSAADVYVGEVNARLDGLTSKLHSARLKAFTQSFA